VKSFKYKLEVFTLHGAVSISRMKYLAKVFVNSHNFFLDHLEKKKIYKNLLFKCLCGFQ
jgi:hypothetical protein